MQFRKLLLVLPILFIFLIYFTSGRCVGEGNEMTCDSQGGEVPQDFSGTLTMKEGGTLNIGGEKFQFKKEGSAIVKNGKVLDLKDAERIETSSGTQATDITSANLNQEREHFDSAGTIQRGTSTFSDIENANFYPNGDYDMQSAASVEQEGVKIINGKGIKFRNGELTAEYADSFIRDGSVTTSIEKLNSKVDFFSVDSADSFLSDCIRVDSIKDSEFKVSNKVKITTKSDVNLKITDCSYNEVTFSGRGRVTVDKTQNPIYILENGTLTKKENGYNETVESNNSVIVETDKTFGFKCLTITPVGSYFYNDNDLRKDFVINVPKESLVYKLCLRKNSAQQFQNYNGLADFVNKKIELNGIVNYLRYPLKNNQIASLLSDFVYKGLKDVKTLLVLDKELLFLDNAEIKNVLQNKQQVTITKPNNYYNIKEMELEDGKIHRIVELNQLNKNQLTQDINYNYGSDSLKPKIKINNNVLVQDNGKNSITFLPPEDERINQILK